MTTYIIPLQPNTPQSVGVLLGSQNYKIVVYEKSTGTYLDLYQGNVAIGTGIKCLDRTAMPFDSYTGFVGQLMFVDTQGFDDPISSGFGTRFQLQWLS